MPQNLLTIRDSLTVSFTNAMTNFMGFIPTLLGALAILALGWLVSHYLARAINKILTKVGFEKAVQKSGLDVFVKQSGTRLTACQVIAELSKWFMRLIFVQAAASILAMPQVTQVITSIVLFIPKVIVAMVILVAGSLISRFLAKLVRGSASKMGSTDPRVLSVLTYYTVMGFAFIAAFSQLEIAPAIVNILFTAFVSSIALAFGLSFGLGGRDVAAEIVRGWYTRSKNAEPRQLRKAG